MAASEDKLSALHDAVATALATLVQGKTIPAEVDEEGAVVAEELYIEPSAAILTVAAKFLKDNNITSTPSKDNKLGELEERMAAQREKRTSRRATAIDKADASENMGFMSGMPIN